jgi:hypothetical protein
VQQEEVNEEKGLKDEGMDHIEEYEREEESEGEE